MPSTCKALVCTKLGDPTQPLGQFLQIDPQWQLRSLKQGQVRIQVIAASLNYADPLLIKGEYQVKVPPPFVPGSECAGVVLEVGPGVTAFKPGDKVCAFSNEAGMFAEQCVAHTSSVWHVPDGVDMALAAAVPVTYGTADVGLRHRAGVRAGQTVLVLGAGGGIGVAAIQLAKVAGAKVIAVTQGAEKVHFVQQQGADAVVDLDSVNASTPLHKLIKQHAPKGVHVVIDPVGGQLFNEALKTVAWGAHVVVIGFAAGGIPKIPANILLVKNTTVHGLYWGSHIMHDPKVLRDSMADILNWVREGRLKPHISHTYTLEQGPAAFETMLKRRMLGKVQITPGTSPFAKL